MRKTTEPTNKYIRDMWRKKITKSQTYMSWHAGMRCSHVNVFVNMTVRVCACWACVYVCECEEECKENWTASMLLLLFGIDDETEEEAKPNTKQSKAKTEWQREINERLVSMVKCRFLIFAYVFFFCFVSFITAITSVCTSATWVCECVCGLAGSLDCPASILVCAVHRDWIDWIARNARF